MRGSTLALAVVAVIAVGALFLSWRGDSSDRPDSKRLSGASAERPGAAGRVQNRLEDLRGAYNERQQPESDQPLSDRASKSSRRDERRAMRREVPTRGALVNQEGPMDGLPYDEDDAEEIEEYRDAILNDPDPDERVGAILMLSGNEHPDAIATFVRALEDSEAEVRLAAVEALGDYTETIEPGSLSRAIDDPDPEVRFEAISVLGDFETPDALALVRQALDDPDEEIRELAQEILEDAEDI